MSEGKGTEKAAEECAGSGTKRHRVGGLKKQKQSDT